MFENLSWYDLQVYWWIIVSLLGATLVFMSFVQGGQSLLNSVAKRDIEKDLVVNALGRKWELTFTSLVVFGGALFAAFPLFYATSFGGAYYLWMAILFCFIIQAVAYEYRSKPNNLFGKRGYELFLFINGSIGIFLLGVAIATLFSGGHFIRDDMNLSRWTLESYGLEALLNIFNVAFGLMLVFLARILGNLYFINSIADENINKRAKRALKIDTIIFLILFGYVTYTILTMDSFRFKDNGVIYKDSLVYLTNFLEMPLLLVAFVLGAILLLIGIYLGAFKNSPKGFWNAGGGVVLVVISLLLILGLNHTVFYPSLDDMQSSLTIANSSGSKYTLMVMAYVSLMVPFVIWYIAIVWRALSRKKIDIKEIKNDPHHY